MLICAMLTLLFEIHQILGQPTTLAKSAGTVHDRWLHTQPLLRPKLRNPASPYPCQSCWKSNNENSIVPSSFLTTSDLFLRIVWFSFSIARGRRSIALVTINFFFKSHECPWTHETLISYPDSFLDCSCMRTRKNPEYWRRKNAYGSCVSILCIR